MRVLRAYAATMDSGKPVNWQAVAREAGISRQRMWDLRVRYPGLVPWLMANCRRRCQEMADAVVERMGVLAMQGSVAHAEVFLKAINGQYTFASGGESGNPGMTFNGPTIIKMGVPGPGDPPLACSPVIKKKTDSES